MLRSGVLREEGNFCSRVTSPFRLPIMNCDFAAPPDAEAQATVLDEQALAGLRTLDPGGQAQLLRRVFLTYLESQAKLRRQLDDAQRRAEPAAMRLAAHTLKSSSASIGALALSRLCAEVERAIRDERVGDVRHLLESLGAEADRVDAEVRRRLADLAQA